MMGYKGYHGEVEFDEEARVFHGHVVDTRDVITFQGKSVDELEQAFRDSVDDYLEFCAERGEEPDRPFSGNFMVRIPSDLHRLVYLAARDRGTSINEFVTETLATATRTVPLKKK